MLARFARKPLANPDGRESSYVLVQLVGTLTARPDVVTLTAINSGFRGLKYLRIGADLVVGNYFLYQSRR